MRPECALQAEFVRGGRTQFIATTWAGYVGVLVRAPIAYAHTQ